MFQYKSTTSENQLSIVNNDQKKTITLTWQFAESATCNVNE